MLTGMDDALAVFVADSTCQLDVLESALLDLERCPDERVVLDAVFRAAHTIKGNASVVHQGEVEWFAHVAESVLVRLRDGVLRIDEELASVLLACCDHLRFLIGQAGRDAGVSPDFAEADRARLIGLLVPYLNGEETVLAPEPHSEQHTASSANECWCLQLRFAPEVLRQGMDPVFFLRHLESLGRIFNLQTFTDAIPPLPDYEPELCYLRFEIHLDTAADRQAIEDVFSFVRDSCELHLTPPQAQIQDYVERIHAMPPDDLQTGEILMRVGALTPDELADSLRRQRVDTAEHKPLGSILVEEGFVPPELLSAVLQRQDEIKHELVHESRQMRVSTEQIEKLVASIGALQCTMDGLLLRSDEVSVAELEVIRQALTQTRELAEALRSTRFSELFRRLHRVVRDTAHELGKRVDLRLSGGDIVLDRSVAELVGDALMHLLRNAIDHGIETPAERQVLGKPAQGLLNVAAWLEDGWLNLSIDDDGIGIDAAKVRAVAVARGLLPEDTQPDAEALCALIFAPGFSTVETASYYSGRGVGLDVVRDAVRALGGEIRVHSVNGKGCRFEIRLPDRLDGSSEGDTP